MESILPTPTPAFDSAALPTTGWAAHRLGVKAPSQRRIPFLPTNAIIEHVADAFDVQPNAVRASGREPHEVAARHIALYLVRELKNLSYPQLARAFGYRDHTSALYAHNRISRLIDEDDVYRDVVGQLRTDLLAIALRSPNLAEPKARLSGLTL
ncbi:hypothetical protein EPN42_10985 [bacterium]|nr:MAG: hypothetical protein EPN42_10985 [bacterium]